MHDPPARTIFWLTSPLWSIFKAKIDLKILADMLLSSLLISPKQISIVFALVRNETLKLGNSLCYFPKPLIFLCILSIFCFNFSCSCLFCYNSFLLFWSGRPKYCFFYSTYIVKRHLALTSSIILLGKSNSYWGSDWISFTNNF